MEVSPFTVPLSFSLTSSFGSCIVDPLVHHGRHFGCVLHAMTNIQALLTNGILQLNEDVLVSQLKESMTLKFVDYFDSHKENSSRPQGEKGTSCIYYSAWNGTRSSRATLG